MNKTQTEAEPGFDEVLEQLKVGDELVYNDRVQRLEVVDTHDFLTVQGSLLLPRRSLASPSNGRRTYSGHGVTVEGPQGGIRRLVWDDNAKSCIVASESNDRLGTAVRLTAHTTNGTYHVEDFSNRDQYRLGEFSHQDATGSPE